MQLWRSRLHHRFESLCQRRVIFTWFFTAFAVFQLSFARSEAAAAAAAPAIEGGSEASFSEAIVASSSAFCFTTVEKRRCFLASVGRASFCALARVSSTTRVRPDDPLML